MLHDFVRGAVSMGFLVAAAFFFRFWRESHDRLFAFFATAFLLMAVNGPALILVGERPENNLVPYLIRLLSYAIIILGIADKNLRRT
jgi:O-antigen/teichoic acid export membrane protein